MKKKVIVLSGAGISAESGIQTFRDADGLWEGHDVMAVASPQGWQEDPVLVLDFYNQRRKQLLSVEPNLAHQKLAELEVFYDVTIITQNIDDLHERAGSSRVVHLHGELLKVRSSVEPTYVMEWKQDLNIGDLCLHNSQLRPHVVWFGEPVPMIEIAAEITSQADFLIIVGTSLQVYPAAGLMSYAPSTIPIFYIDPAPKQSVELQARPNIEVLAARATVGIAQVVQSLIEECKNK
ncbi:MAG: NAD-dependent deacylase [Saprospiraceae bacterium]|nr:NAD-dependent deacylase [Saprospiraceae bacterium]